jgi:signal transduction histidine kinase
VTGRSADALRAGIGGEAVSGAVFRGEAGEVLRQASAVVGRPVTLWEVTGPDQMVQRASSEPPLALSSIDLDGTLRRWSVPLAVGSRWVAAPADVPGGCVIAPVRWQPPAPPPPPGRERRSRERLALELAGLALGLIDRRQSAALAADTSRHDPLQELASLPAMIAHEASNPLTAARAGLQMAMEVVGRWVDLGADRRLTMLDDLGEVIEDIDRATEFLRAVQDRARGVVARSERFDAVRVVRSCLTLERRLLRDRGIELDFATSVDSAFLKGDPNALFDVLVNLVRNASDASAHLQAPVEVRLSKTEQGLQLIVRDRGAGIASEHLQRIFEAGFTTKEFGKGSGMGLAKVRSVAEGMFHGTVRVESQVGQGATFTVVLPLPPQRGSDPLR